jgi:uncharacterized protein YdeI (YjbR/CyaY-like superfamily)
MEPKVDEYINKSRKWQEELKKLRTILLGCQLNEEVKWGKPCYSFQKSNIVMMIGFKEYLAMMFFKGALLHDAHGLLVKAGDNSQASRQIRFTGVKQINEMETLLKTYVYEAIEVEKSGLKVSFKKTTDFDIPEEFQNKLDKNPSLKKAFESLTPGRQRAYLIYFSAAKQAKTRESRIEKYLPHILNGKGMDDR